MDKNILAYCRLSNFKFNILFQVFTFSSNIKLYSVPTIVQTYMYIFDIDACFFSIHITDDILLKRYAAYDIKKCAYVLIQERLFHSITFMLLCYCRLGAAV